MSEHELTIAGNKQIVHAEYVEDDKIISIRFVIDGQDIWWMYNRTEDKWQNEEGRLLSFDGLAKWALSQATGVGEA